MPTINENLKWAGYAWGKDGDEWSNPWGGTEKLWYGSIFPRIFKFLPTESVLEVAPGYGRCTHYLKELCKKLYIVDLNKNCIDYCKKRFSNNKNISYFTNNGRTLEMIPSKSMDFIFSWDSLVHVDKNDIYSYISEFSRILKDSGVCFIHHSNLGSIKENIKEDHWRAKNVDSINFKEFCEKNGLSVISQEVVNWSGNYLTDCFSIFTKNNTSQNDYVFLKNEKFGDEKTHIRKNFDASKIKNLPFYIPPRKLDLFYYKEKTLRVSRVFLLKIVGKIGIFIRKISPSTYQFLKKFLNYI